MARRKTKEELERQALAKAVRASSRVKYAIAADEEINEVLWPILDEWDTALGSGEAFEFDLAELSGSIKRLK